VLHRSIFAIWLALSILFSIGCGSANRNYISDRDAETTAVNRSGERYVHAHKWGIADFRRESVVISVAIPHCEYVQAEPSFDRITRRWRSGDLILTAFMRTPPRTQHGCLGIELYLLRRVKVGKNLRHIELYDGSTSPPTRRSRGTRRWSGRAPGPATAAEAGTNPSPADQPFCGYPALPVGEDPPLFKVRLGLKRETVHPGGNLRIRVENLGAGTVSYGYSYRLARFSGGRWINPLSGGFFVALLGALGGHAGRCQDVPIPSGAVAGRYRIAKEISAVQSEEKRSVVVRATFQVR
jgi:hypothetical protein